MKTSKTSHTNKYTSKNMTTATPYTPTTTSSSPGLSLTPTTSSMSNDTAKFQNLFKFQINSRTQNQTFQQ